MSKGSSPRLRGTPDVLDHLCTGPGIIPALAGNTCRCSPWDAHDVDGGSSPRLRGTPTCPRSARQPTGIIPALAGNTNSLPTRFPRSRDHPRACGEHLCKGVLKVADMGSSPRLRGTRRREHERQRGQGIIPALAGNTVRALFAHDRSRDHPRACGEHYTGHIIFRLMKGSSPRLRGTPALVLDRDAGRGIIPALAGNTNVSCPPGRCQRDHPRACGEHYRPQLVDFRSAGSSPRLRGTPRSAVRTA